MATTMEYYYGTELNNIITTYINIEGEMIN